MILAPLNALGLKVTLIAASNLHDSMLRSVLRAPILFFDRYNILYVPCPYPSVALDFAINLIA